MDRMTNPFAGGAGNRPAKLAGRDDIVRDIEVMLKRVQAGKSERGFILTGLRGVGKTTLLLEAQKQAEVLGYQTVLVEMPEKLQSVRLIDALYPKLELFLKQGRPISAAARSAFNFLSELASRLQLDMSVGRLSLSGQTAPFRHMETNLQHLFELLGKAAQEQNRFLLISIDEMHYMERVDLSALSMAMHAVAQRSLPIVFVGAGLPQIRSMMGEAKTYAERLMRYPSIGPLDQKAAFDALQSPAQENDETFAPEALQHIYEQTKGYPYYLQIWGQKVWNIAKQSPITLADAHKAREEAMRELDQEFFLVRFDKMTPNEKRYVYALAQLGAGPQRSSSVAKALGKDSTQVAPIRARLIDKGIIHSAEHGLMEFSAPLFDDFLKRSMGGAFETLSLPLSDPQS